MRRGRCAFGCGRSPHWGEKCAPQEDEPKPAPKRKTARYGDAVAWLSNDDDAIGDDYAEHPGVRLTADIFGRHPEEVWWDACTARKASEANRST